MFYDRTQAGEQLAHKLSKYKKAGKPLVIYGLPRGGVVVAAEVAKFLCAPLDIIVTRKITHPWNPEYAIGAIGKHIDPVINPIELENLSQRWLDEQIKTERRELKRRLKSYLAGREPVSPYGKIAILIDDGVATGMTMQAAIEELRELEPAKLIVAVPVAPTETAEGLAEQADDLVVLHKPRRFAGGVGAYYEDFEQTTDREVVELLNELYSNKPV